MQSTHTPKAYKIHLHELPLLFIRCLLLALPCFFMASWVFNTKLEPSSKTQKWLLVDPALGGERPLSKLVLPWIDQGYSIHLLQHDFPEVDIETEGHTITLTDTLRPLNFWSLLKSLGNEHSPPDSIVILTYGRQHNFSGTRPQLPYQTRWILFPDSLSKHQLLEVLPHKQDSLLLKKGVFKEDISQVSLEAIAKADHNKNNTHPNDSVYALDSMYIKLILTPQFKTDVQVLKLALEVVSEYTRIPFSIEEINWEDIKKDEMLVEADWYFILTGLNTAKLVNTWDGNKVVYAPRRGEDSWFSPTFMNTSLQHLLNHRLRTDSLEKPEMLDNLPQELCDLLLPKKTWEQSAFAIDRRRLAGNQIIYNQVEKQREIHTRYRYPASRLGWYLVLILLAIERILSHYIHGQK